MPKETFGNSQIKELRFSDREIIDIVKQHIIKENLIGYDFDYEKPIMIKFDYGLTFRFVQKFVTNNFDLENK